jgi:hypothetical protein
MRTPPQTEATMTATARMKIDWELTLLYGVEFQEQLFLTYEGQAHFASTGLAGARCRGCTYWGDGGGQALNRPCRKFSAMTGVRSKPVPGSALACRHFEKRK